MDTSLQAQWHPRTNTAIFVRALHLLNLDLLPDWPHISESTFLPPSKASSNPTTPGAQPQNRTKSLEWALYHLFRVYSPSEAVSRLSTCFPPTTPMQSRDLRAGIYKWLAELKQSGVLPRETVLRKTMLDECKGDKFEELIARFAMLVLRKTLSQDHTEVSSNRQQVKQKTRDVVGRQQKYSSEITGKHQDPDSLVPLILAYRVSLQHSLRQRQDLRDKATAYSRALIQIRNDVASGLDDSSQTPSGPDTSQNALSAAGYKSLSERINLAFARDRRWARHILEGYPPCSKPPSTRDLPEWPFQEALPSTLQTGTTDAEDDADQPIQQLQSLISRHQGRISRLAAVRDSLLSASGSINSPEKPQILPPLSTAEAVPSIGESHLGPSNLPNRPKPRFNRHQDLVMT
ncbi:hypothetical protein FOPE_09674 [Fonsecaea pedrosoi]|nr:hypothetical protein FOPE_09674 [Fonsecaea pedrosoi]